MEKLKPGKLSIWSLLAFGIGDINGGGAFNIVNLFYAYFLTDAVRLDPALAAPIFLTGTILDAFTDPVMGYLSDHTTCRMGRRRPYILAGAPAVLLSMLFLWYSPDFESQILRFLTALLAYLIFCIVQTVVMVPYACLAEELSPDYHERTRINAIRLTFYILSALACAVIPEMILEAFGKQHAGRGYWIMGAIFGGLFCIALAVSALFSREHVTFLREKIEFDFKSLIKGPLSVKSYRYFIGMSLVTYLSHDIVLSVFIYIATYWLNRSHDLPVMLGTIFIAQIAALPLFTWLSGRFGKARIYMIGAVIWIIGSLAAFTMGPGTSPYVVLAYIVVIGVGISALELSPHTMAGDVADTGELFFGDRREGIFGGLNTFIRKISLALSSALLMGALSLTGYRKPIARIMDGRLQNIEQIQPESAILAMRIILSLAPVGFLIIGIFLASRYRITPEIHQRLCDHLKNRRNGKADAAEEKALKELL